MKDRAIGQVASVKPCGSQILVELLTPQEQFGTVIHVNQDTRVETPEALVLAVGPSVKCEDWGFDVGDRVLLSAKVTPVPNYDNGRIKCLLEPMAIKGVIVESFN